jgi:AraC-like DNA-binding protein
MAATSSYFFKIDGPLLAPPPYGTMKACGFLEGVGALVSHLGGRLEPVIERHGIDPLTAHDPDYAIRCTSAAAILDECSRAFDDPLFGLRLGANLQAEVYGAITSYARVACDMRQAITVLLEFMPVIYCPGADVEFVAGNETAEFRWRANADFASDEQANYLGQSQVLRFLRSLAGPDFRPSAVRVASRPSRSDIEAMERFFGCKVHGDAAANVIAFPAAWLDFRSIAANPMLFGLLGSYFDQVRRSAEGTFVDEVRAFARATLATGHCTIERCAVKLEASARTIQRRLIEQGLRFSEIVEEERVEAARRALVETGHSLSDIALNLGYSDQSSFGRAFKRWTGWTPQVFRETRGTLPSRFV